eukprot:CAMPEP_0202869010 /NCGR_PEP_ID=MMETSP1391-20130828/11577_1 /ASSEMBLY_ACC=CAM_ASM_000867 /TAXON_ID=1034604 /ORGANISM="Chlamydomonas leiostraca, Strain SAG 11-49" /LENGTH=174 /DNA_ID=CAMNT_0049549247 /DNA_START=158 /DNA_END=682 /DNA_ORIENTATION=-
MTDDPSLPHLHTTTAIPHSSSSWKTKSSGTDTSRSPMLSTRSWLLAWPGSAMLKAASISLLLISESLPISVFIVPVPVTPPAISACRDALPAPPAHCPDLPHVPAHVLVVPAFSNGTPLEHGLLVVGSWNDCAEASLDRTINRVATLLEALLVNGLAILELLGRQTVCMLPVMN